MKANRRQYTIMTCDGRSLRLSVQTTNHQRTTPVDAKRFEQAVQLILKGHQIGRAQVSIAVVSDRTIRRLNRQFLGHDYATDVLTFVYSRNKRYVEGELVVSAETARRTSRRLGIRVEDELLLYVVHGLLHLVGYDDAVPRQQARMRNLESRYLRQLGVDLAGFEFKPGGDAVHSVRGRETRAQRTTRA